MAKPPGAQRSSSWSKLAPSSDFYYRPSGEILSGSFRVVKVLPGRYDDPLACHLQEVSMRENHTIRYVALSYCWNSTAAEDEILCDNRRIKITQNLFAALRNARATNSIVNLWIDQLCIDQTNIIDRNEQVAKMGAIYRAASGVVIWLGEEGIGTNEAMELPKRIVKYWPSLSENPSELLDSTKTPSQCPAWGQHPWPAFEALLTRPWFRRLWVIQEVACARNVLVTCGKATAPWDCFVELVRVVESVHHASASSYHLLGLKRTIHYIRFMEELRSITEQGSKQAVRDYASEESMAPYVLTMAKDCEATDHRDKLFAFHHLVRLWNRPDYAVKLEMLYKLFAMQYLERIAYAISEFSCDERALYRRQLEILYSAGTCNQDHDLPSWVPDWSVPWRARPFWLGSTCYRAGGDEIKEVTPRTATGPKGETTFHLPLTVKLYDTVIAAGTNSFTSLVPQGSSHTLPDALRSWIFDTLGILHRERSPSKLYSNQHEAIARTIAADQDTDGSQITSPAAVQAYDSLLDSLREADELRSGQQNPHALATQALHFAASFMRGRVFCLTAKGHYCLAQAGVKSGDAIAVIRGAPVPVVISRRNDTEPWTLKCEAFVLGIMDGEAWENGTIPTQEIVLV